MRKPLLVALLALLVSGCMIGPDYFRPAVDTPPAWRLSEQNARDLANTAWWEQFGDPVLNDLVATALRENKDLMIAAARVEEFAGNYGIVRSGLFPQVGAGYEPSRQRNTLPGDVEPSTYNSYQAVLNAGWEIDIWGRIRRQTEAANAQLLASEEGRRGVILSLVGGVAASYINLRALDRQLEIAKGTAKSRGESYEIFKLRFSGGVISLLELSQNKSQYEEALASIPPLEKAIAQQENGLSVLLGRNPGPIVRGKNIDQLDPADDPGRSAFGPARTPARHPARRTEPDRRQCPDRRCQGGLLPDHLADRTLRLRQSRSEQSVRQPVEGVAIRRADQHAHLYRRRACRSAAGRRSDPAAGTVRISEGDPGSLPRGQ